MLHQAACAAAQPASDRARDAPTHFSLRPSSASWRTRLLLCEEDVVAPEVVGAQVREEHPPALEAGERVQARPAEEKQAGPAAVLRGESGGDHLALQQATDAVDEWRERRRGSQ